MIVMMGNLNLLIKMLFKLPKSHVQVIKKDNQKNKNNTNMDMPKLKI